ncbi:NADH-quinone oxidoreductase subunit NuoF [Candidatus Calescamantes bacterium]|nr:NADH-quinone oxidoreductase subunit NuoF [Candidatus Calescamantes bacterium]
MNNIKRIKVGMASCGLAAGAQEIYDILSADLGDKLEGTGCIGMCFREPLIEIEFTDGRNLTIGDVDPERARLLAEKLTTEIPEEWIIYDTASKEFAKQPYFSKQHKIALRNSGIINPESIEEYLEKDGYEGLKKALKMPGDDLCQLILDSGLRGRGGAGFPTGLKWKFARRSQNDQKYIICNADEGDPGAFMDRSLLEGDPHAVLEGMVIGGCAIGATMGYIYVRAEYPLAIERLEKALIQARENGFIGKNIFGSGFDFDLEIKKGAGAFVCGEETALMHSIEGDRGMPTLKPPFPAESGLWGKPSNINNVETLANIPWIVFYGADKYAAIGTEDSKGTKVFALTGKVKYSGTVEVPMGSTLREIIFDISGGIKNDKQFKAVQIGGPSGGCLPESLLDTVVEYKALNATGAIMGSGGMVVMDEETCMVDVAKYFLNFTVEESCGKCTFCRIGTRRMYEILDRISRGEGKMSDLDELEKLGHQVKNGSLCGLGQTAPNPVITSLKYFRDEYVAHIEGKKCPAGVCKELISFTIDEEKCTGCTLCARNCPVDAISGEVKKLHLIDQEACIKCGKCYDVCRFDAVIKE